MGDDGSGKRDLSRGLLRVLGDEHRADPLVDPPLGPEQRIRLLWEMKRIRALDARLTALQRQGRVGFYGPALGQEAVVVAATLALEPSDWIFPALRESTAMLVRGFALERYLAQIYGKGSDQLKGRMMPSHASAREVNVVSWSSSIATQLPHAVGAAMAMRRRRDRAVVLAFVGDGGTSHPDFHAAMNFAGVFGAPCIIVCQNNHWAISTPSSRQTASVTFAVKARAYGMPGLRVDGNDALAVHRAISDARERAAGGRGPTFIECVTYRMGAHSTSDDPTRYQPAAELEEWARRDPIARFKQHLEHLGVLDAAQERRMDEQIEAGLDVAIRAVESEGPPELSTLFDDVYAERPFHLEEQRRELLRRADLVTGRRPG